MVWELRLDIPGPVQVGRVIEVVGELTDDGAPIEGWTAPHTFHISVEQLRDLIFDEDMTAEEAVEHITGKLVRDLQRVSAPTPADVLPDVPGAFPTLADKTVRGDPKANRTARAVRP